VGATACCLPSLPSSPALSLAFPFPLPLLLFRFLYLSLSISLPPPLSFSFSQGDSQGASGECLDIGWGEDRKERPATNLQQTHLYEHADKAGRRAQGSRKVAAYAIIAHFNTHFYLFIICIFFLVYKYNTHILLCVLVCFDRCVFN